MPIIKYDRQERTYEARRPILM